MAKVIDGIEFKYYKTAYNDLVYGNDEGEEEFRGEDIYKISVWYATKPIPLTNSSQVALYFEIDVPENHGLGGIVNKEYNIPHINITVDGIEYTVDAFIDENQINTTNDRAGFPVYVSTDGGTTRNKVFLSEPIQHNMDGNKSVEIDTIYFFNGIEYVDSYDTFEMSDENYNKYTTPHREGNYIYLGRYEYYLASGWCSAENIGDEYIGPQQSTFTYKMDKLGAAPSSTTCPTSYIGSETTIGIIPQSTSATHHTLTYEFGDLTGTIVERTTATSVKWLIPTSFYSQLLYDKMTTCKIICTTYQNSTPIGTTTSTFIVAVSDENAPILSPIVEELEAKALALTGNKDVLIRYYSGVNFAFNAIAQNGASIKSYLLTYGAGRYTIPNGQIGYIESDTFTFKATDTRGLTTTSVIKKQVIPYFRPTCYIIRKSSSPEGNLVINIKGNCFNGSFGLVDNDLTIKYRYKVSTDDYFSEWEEVSPTRNSDNTYIAEVAFPYLDYRKTYVFEAVATDTIFSTTSQETRIDFMPVFDWSLHDFNFNIDIYGNGMEMIRPYNENGVMNVGYGGYREGYGATNIFGNEVNIETNDAINFYASSSINLDANDNVNMNAPLVMNGTTVLRHNSSASNLVIATDGGSIFFRPNGDESGTAEVRIYPDGVVKITGDIVLNGVSLADKLGI